MGAHDHITRALADGVPVTPASLAPGFSGVLAVDAWDGWGAGYYLRITAGGRWSSDVHVVQAHGSQWWPIGDGGAHGEGWPAEGWPPDVDDAGLVLGPSHCVGTIDAANDDLRVRAQVGYAGSRVRAVRIDDAGATRIVAVGGLLRAFVVVGRDGSWPLTPLNGVHDSIGPTIVIEPGWE